MIWLLAASLLWAFSFGLIKQHLTGLDPWWVAAARLSLAALVFLPWTVTAAPAATGLRVRAMLLGAVQFGAMYVFYIAAFVDLAAWQVALWTLLTPVFVALLGAWRDRRRPLRPLGAALLAVAGALVAEGRLPAAETMRGVLLVQGSNLCFALGQLGYRPLREATRRAGPPRHHEAGLLGWMYLGGAALAVAGAMLFGDAVPPRIHGDAVAVLVYLGLIATAVGFWLWNKGAARTGTARLAVANNLKVPLAILAAWLVFQESAQYVRAACGLAVMIGGLVIAGARGAPTPPSRDRG